jgi:hypothetical protein
MWANPTVSAKVSKKKATARSLFSFLGQGRRAGRRSVLRVGFEARRLQHVGECHRFCQESCYQENLTLREPASIIRLAAFLLFKN